MVEFCWKNGNGLLLTWIMKMVWWIVWTFVDICSMRIYTPQLADFYILGYPVLCKTLISLISRVHLVVCSWSYPNGLRINAILLCHPSHNNNVNASRVACQCVIIYRLPIINSKSVYLRNSNYPLPFIPYRYCLAILLLERFPPWSLFLASHEFICVLQIRTIQRLPL